MIKGFRTASVWSQDLNNLLPFYRDVVGLPVGMESDRFVVLGDPNGASMGLGSHTDVKGKNADPARHMIGLETDDIKADVAALKSHGVEFVEDATDFGGVWVATFRDPEGNLVQLLQFSGQM